MRDRHLGLTEIKGTVTDLQATLPEPVIFKLIARRLARGCSVKRVGDESPNFPFDLNSVLQ
jgi:hypothetical protein